MITSLPDASELPECDFEGWRSWFVGAARAVLDWVPPKGVAIFFQSDVLRQGVWVDKAFLVMSGAEGSGAELVWHKIVCRTPPGSLSVGRAGYSHLLCFSRSPRPAFRHPFPDVVSDGGFKASEKAMGEEACLLACRFLLAATETRTVVDPFCGQGTVLAAANALGLDAIGVDRSVRACRAARRRQKLDAPCDSD
ncbi:MAG TPA: DNA methyltransferase [Polyangiaceae bacterium]